LSQKTVALSLVVLCVFAAATSARPVFSSNSQQAVSVWSEISIERGGAYSWSGYSANLAELPAVRDCLRPFPIDCFSLQQNFWISDHFGNEVLWARNMVYLASLGGSYHGTFSFQVYSRFDRDQPMLCEPQSNSTSTCRSPFYVDYSPFPQPFEFYAHISTSSNLGNMLQMVNNFGAVTWNLPTEVVCPCFIDTASNPSQPWGAWPYEFVAVGIDSTATATFRNNTMGTIGSTLVQYTDGSWHQSTLGILGCEQVQDCLRMLSTQEFSTDLKWDMERGEVYWSNGSLDQGVHITGIMQDETVPPVLPTPKGEIYLYVEFSSTLAYLTIYDNSRRASGIDPQTGHSETAVPNSSLVLDSYIPVKDTPANVPEEELLIVDPQGEYQILVTAGGNTAYSVFLSKVTNRNQALATNSFAGSLFTGDSKSLQMNSTDLALTATPQVVYPGIVSMAAVIIALVSFVFVVLVLLARRRKRLLKLRPDYDEFR
jgi:hypothetical protein